MVSSSVAQKIYIKAGKASWRTDELSRIEKAERPLLFEQLVFRTINEEGISIQKGVELLQIQAINKYMIWYRTIRCKNELIQPLGCFCDKNG